jgi:hypothetical protein
MNTPISKPDPESPIGKYIVIERIDGYCQGKNQVHISPSAPGSDPIKINGRYWNYEVHFVRDRNASAELKLTEVIDDINAITYSEYSDVPKSNLHIFKIINIRIMWFYNYTLEVPKYDDEKTILLQYPKNKDQMTPDSMFYDISFDVEKV